MDIYTLLDILAVILALLLAIIGHEIMHARMAYRYGDTTAKEQGRFSINPISHIDPVGTILLPAILYISNAGFMFGWAKPVPIDMQKVVRNGGFIAGIQVSLAGIYYNFFLVLISFILLKTIPLHPSNPFEFFIGKFLFHSLVYNTILGVFNLLPFPPLDGSKALMFTMLKMGFYKGAYFIQRMENYGMILLFIIIAIPGLSNIVFYPIQLILHKIISLLVT